LELQIASFINELQNTNDMRDVLSELMIAGAKECEVSGKKAIIVYVPINQQKLYQKIHTRFIRELEKKFSGKHVFICAYRTILPKPARNSKNNLKQKRPISRTLTSVHDNILSDLVFPAEIVGKRIRISVDGKRLIKCHLEKSQQFNIEHKIDTVASLYKQLTGKDVAFEFPEWTL